jgi:hypothetical protein
MIRSVFRHICLSGGIKNYEHEARIHSRQYGPPDLISTWPVSIRSSSSKESTQKSLGRDQNWNRRGDI